MGDRPSETLRGATGEFGARPCGTTVDQEGRAWVLEMKGRLEWWRAPWGWLYGFDGAVAWKVAP